MLTHKGTQEIRTDVNLVNRIRLINQEHLAFKQLNAYFN